LAVALAGSLAQAAFSVAPGQRPACETGPAISCGCQPIGPPAQEAITGAPARWHEQFGFAYDPAGNLNYRTNNALLETFTPNPLNELSTVIRSGTLTVAGTTTSAATNVTVNSFGALIYADSTFARTNLTVATGSNTFTAIASDSYGRADTNAVTVNLPSSLSYSYDLNGNLLSDGSRGFDYDDENQLIRITVTNGWKSEFTYDGQMRRRIRKEFTWQNSALVQLRRFVVSPGGHIGSHIV
jgi:YD repeat-containing protein